jgi:hypothetical protein
MCPEPWRIAAVLQRDIANPINEIINCGEAQSPDWRGRELDAERRF